MLDLETLGTRPGCVVLSIGAVSFEYTSGLGEEFYVVINQKSCEAAGLTADRATLGWWMSKSPEAREVLTQSRKGGVPLVEAVEQFTSYVKKFDSEVRVWGCGSDFDNPIVSHLYHVLGKRQPWKYPNNRCYRTLKNLVPAIPMERVGTYHNALDDAKSQALHAIKILGRLGEVLKA